MKPNYSSETTLCEILFVRKVDGGIAIQRVCIPQILMLLQRLDGKRLKIRSA